MQPEVPSVLAWTGQCEGCVLGFECVNVMVLPSDAGMIAFAAGMFEHLCHPAGPGVCDKQLRC